MSGDDQQVPDDASGRQPVTFDHTFYEIAGRKAGHHGRFGDATEFAVNALEKILQPA